MKYPCIESTLDMTVRGITIRLWINEKTIESAYYPNLGYEAKIRDYVEEMVLLKKTGIVIDTSKNEQEALVEFCKKVIPNLNAIQIKNETHGLVVYLVDFQDDPHG